MRILAALFTTLTLFLIGQNIALAANETPNLTTPILPSQEIATPATIQECRTDSCPIPDSAIPENKLNNGQTDQIDESSENRSMTLDNKQNSRTIAQETGRFAQVQHRAAEILAEKNYLVISLVFWIFGMLLALTPCTLPVLLVLTTFLMNQGIEAPKYRLIKLAISYILAMAATYAFAGIISAMAGIYIQIYFQKDWIIVTSCILIAVLAFSLLGFYKIKLPQMIRVKLVRFNTLSASNTYGGAALMGVIATLLASPCTAAPLVGALTFISHNGSIMIGGLALFSMGIGVGTPLMIISIAGENILPRMQNWQSGLQSFFGLLLLAVAIWLASRIMSPVIILALWSALAIMTAVNMGALRETSDEGGWVFWRTMSILLLVYGIALFVGALMGNKNPFNPLSSTMSTEIAPIQSQFTYVETLEELQTKIESSKLQQQPILIDFYADWCSVCKKMETNIFGNTDVRNELAHVMLIRVDLTKLVPEKIKIMKAYDVSAPPVVIFYDKRGVELPERLLGDATAEQFITKLKLLINQSVSDQE